MWVLQPTSPAARDASGTPGSEELRPAPQRHAHSGRRQTHITVSPGLSGQRATRTLRCPWCPGGVARSAGHAETSRPRVRRAAPASWARGSRVAPARGVGEGDLQALGTASRPAGPQGPRGQVWPPGCGSRVTVPGDLVGDTSSPVSSGRLERCLARKRDDLRPVHVVHSCRLRLGGKGLTGAGVI